jgi:archaellin
MVKNIIIAVLAAAVAALVMAAVLQARAIRSYDGTVKQAISGAYMLSKKSH